MTAFSRKHLIAFLIILCSGVTGTALAGEIVVGAQLIRITNTSSNTNAFSIMVSGGTLNLCGSSWINFPASATDAESYKRAYAAALVALTTGAPIRVYNYQSNTCETASYIELSAP